MSGRLSGNDYTSTSKKNIAYKLFLHQKELSRRSADKPTLPKTKLRLTQGLLSTSVDHLKNFDRAELKNVKRELKYSKTLKNLVYMLKLFGDSLLKPNHNYFEDF